MIWFTLILEKCKDDSTATPNGKQIANDIINALGIMTGVPIEPMEDGSEE